MAADASNVDLAPFIDHALLAPTATPEQVEHWCEECDRFGFASICIPPAFVHQAAQLLHGKKPKVCTVIGFPHGSTTSATKLYEAQEAVDLGAVELDVVINVGWLKAGMTEAVHRELAQIQEATDQVMKVILELGLLTQAEKQVAAEIAMDAGAAFLKTSTGLYGGATLEDVRLLKQLSRDRLGIKASGGIRTAEQACQLIAAGATRIGTSRGPELLQQQKEQGR